MLFGFMLTAVPNWTGEKRVTGRPLMVLALLWGAARILIACPVLWPPLVIGAVDLAFLPALGLLIGPSLLRARNRNSPLLLVIGILWLANLVFYLGIIRHDDALALRAIIVGIDVVLILVTVIGGRIVPAFTTAALRQRGEQGSLRSNSALTVLAVAAMVAVALGDVFQPDTQIAGLIAGTAAVLQGLRLLQWETRRTLRQPIVWVLHLAYAWLPVGLAMKAAALLGGFAIFVVVYVPILWTPRIDGKAG